MWIMISGPYTTGAQSADDRRRNLAALNVAAYQILRKGHVPVIGVNMALPIVEAAGADTFDDVMRRLSLALAERCDAVLRLEGASSGADEEVTLIRARGGQVYRAMTEIPDLRERP
jgi:hypothetical protein